MTLLLLLGGGEEGGPCWDFDGSVAFTYDGCDDDD